MRDRPGGLPPNLNASAMIMRLPIGRIVVLVGIEVALWLARSQRLHRLNRAVRALQRVSKDELDVISAQNGDPLLADVLRQVKLDAIALGRADHGVGDAGVAAGAVEDDLARAQVAFRFGAADDAISGAVLDAAARVLPLGFCQDAHIGRQMLADAAEAKQRRIADLPLNIPRIVAACRPACPLPVRL